MDNERLSLKYIINAFHSKEELRKWAEENEMTNHPLVTEKLKKNQPSSIQDIVNGFTDIEELTQWATENLLLQHRHVIERFTSLLTCKWCHLKFDSQNELKPHEELHALIDNLNGHTTVYCDTESISGAPENNNSTDVSPICLRCNIRFDSRGDLTHHEELHELIDQLNGQNDVLRSDSLSQNSYSQSMHNEPGPSKQPDLFRPRSDQGNISKDDTPEVVESDTYLEDLTSVLLVCLWCNVQFDSYESLREHEQQYHQSASNVKSKGEASIECDDVPTKTMVQSASGRSKMTPNNVTTDHETSITEGHVPEVQYGAGDPDQSYIFQMTGQKTFSKNLARETTYKVKFTDKWQGTKLISTPIRS